ncbi:MAG: PadR family transcriptional regulator [Clostridiales bacterium]|nr:PadR family transcriptional regulator [Clostridiales bacterium]
MTLEVYLDIQLKKGLLEICVLASLSSEQSYGYKIMTELSSILEISESTLYPILKRLEHACLLSTKQIVHNGRLRKYYQITNQGKQKLIDYGKDIENLHKVTQFVKDKLYTGNQ